MLMSSFCMCWNANLNLYKILATIYFPNKHSTLFPRDQNQSNLKPTLNLITKHPRTHQYTPRTRPSLTTLLNQNQERESALHMQRWRWRWPVDCAPTIGTDSLVTRFRLNWWRCEGFRNDQWWWCKCWHLVAQLWPWIGCEQPIVSLPILGWERERERLQATNQPPLIAHATPIEQINPD